MSPSGINAETFALAIDQLRLLRNALLHSTSSEMDIITYDQRVQHAKDAFEALGVTTAVIDAVGRLTGSDFPTNEVHKLEQRQRKETQAYIKFLEVMSADISELRTLSTVIKRRVESDTADKDDIAMLDQKIDELIKAKDEADERDTRANEILQNGSSDINELRSNSAAIKQKVQIYVSYIYIHLKQKVESDVPNKEHADTADSYHSLGIKQHKLGDYTSALQSKQHALDVRRKLFGEEHADTANSHHSLGLTQHQLGDYTSALQSHQHALDVRRKLFGEEHADTADSNHLVG